MGKFAHPAERIRANQEIANSLREEVKNLYPPLRNISPQQAGGIELEKAIDSFMRREGNKQVTPFFVPMIAAGFGGAGAGAMYGGSMEATAGGLGAASAVLAANLVRSAIEDPAVKSAIAIALRRVANTYPKTINLAAKAAPYIMPTGAKAGLAAVQTIPPPKSKKTASTPATPLPPGWKWE